MTQPSPINETVRCTELFGMRFARLAMTVIEGFLTAFRVRTSRHLEEWRPKFNKRTKCESRIIA
jgi:hypothetical protein